MNVTKFISSISNNAIAGAFAKSWDLLDRYLLPVCSISGGSDSDIVLDIIHRLDVTHKVRYVWFNTGLELNATRRHLDFLQDKYSITIERINPVMYVPACVKRFGYPFISKVVSQKIHNLQSHGFDFKDRNYDEDLNLFPQANDGLKWWHNIGSFKQWNICYNKLLKEFLIVHPPQFSISDKCCYYAKKKSFAAFFNHNYCDLSIIGTRKAEGGIRARGNNCFTHSDNKGDVFRPIFWFSDYDKKVYERLFHVVHSDCYNVYGLKRTGCAGCPFNPTLFTDLLLIQKHEMGLVNAAYNVFKPVYDYTKLYREFCNMHGSTLPLLEEDFSYG